MHNFSIFRKQIYANNLNCKQATVNYEMENQYYCMTHVLGQNINNKHALSGDANS